MTWMYDFTERLGIMKMEVSEKSKMEMGWDVSVAVGWK